MAVDHGHNYHNTVIAVAPDSPVSEAKVPQPRGATKTVAMLQYELLHDQPWVHTQEDVLFGVWLARQPELADQDLAADELATLREQFFAKGQPCLRASPLTKTHGWGVLFDDEGRAALCAMESDRYRAALSDGDLTVVAAMRSKKA